MSFRTSYIWSYFLPSSQFKSILGPPKVQQIGDQAEVALCLLCPSETDDELKKALFKHGKSTKSSTKNLIDHLESHHKLFHKVFERNSSAAHSQAITEFFPQKESTKPSYDSRKARLASKFLLLIAKGLVSVRTMRDDCFQDFATDAGFNVFGKGHNAIMKRILESSKAINMMVDQIIRASSSLCGQLDYYTPKRKFTSYLGLGVSGIADCRSAVQTGDEHAATGEEKHFEFAVGLQQILEGRKTAGETTTRVVGRLDSRGIDMDKFVGWVSDGDELATQKKLLEKSAAGAVGQWCFAHRLNLCLCDSLADIEPFMCTFSKIHEEMKKIPKEMNLIQLEVIERAKDEGMKLTMEYFHHGKDNEDEVQLVDEGTAEVERIDALVGDETRKYPTSSLLDSVILGSDSDEQLFVQSGTDKPLIRPLKAILTTTIRWETMARLAIRTSRLQKCYVFDLLLHRFDDMEEQEQQRCATLCDILRGISSDDWKYLNFVSQVLEKVVYGVLKPIQQQSGNGICDLLSRLLACHRDISAMETSDDWRQKNFKKSVLENLEMRVLGLPRMIGDSRRSADIPPVLIAAMVLSPTIGLREFKSEARGNIQSTVEEHLCDTIVTLERPDVLKTARVEKTKRAAELAQAEVDKAERELNGTKRQRPDDGFALKFDLSKLYDPQLSRKRARIGEFDGSDEAVNAKFDVLRQQVKAEFAGYLAYIVSEGHLSQYEDESGHVDVLSYWSHRQRDSPLLYKIMMDRICPLVSAAVEMERMFSVATRLTLQRDLDGESLEQFTLLSQNVNQLLKLGLKQELINAIVMSIRQYCKK